MSTYPFITRAVLLSSMLLIASLSAPTVHALDSDLLKGTMVFAPASELNVVAAGTVEDTLKACLGRIPLDATVGQRLLAEQSCTGEEGTRKLVPGAQKF